MKLVVHPVFVPFLFGLFGGVRLSSVICPLVTMVPDMSRWAHTPRFDDRGRGQRSRVAAIANAQRIAQRNSNGFRRR